MKHSEGVKHIKIVFTTNVAETAVTFDNVSTVIDSGFEKNPQYNPKTGVIEFNYERISQNSANQRAGRTGRQEPGKCYRMYTKQEFDNMEEERKPPIVRQNIGILQIGRAHV